MCDVLAAIFKHGLFAVGIKCERPGRRGSVYSWERKRFTNTALTEGLRVGLPSLALSLGLSVARSGSLWLFLALSQWLCGSLWLAWSVCFVVVVVFFGCLLALVLCCFLDSTPPFFCFSISFFLPLSHL